jgi:hypothetical protein
MTLGTPLFHLCRKNLSREDEFSGAYSDTIKALLEKQSPLLDFIEHHQWVNGDLPSSPWARIDLGENLLAAALLISLAGKKIAEYPQLLREIEVFTQKSGWPRISLVTGQAQLLQLLAGISDAALPAEADGYYPFVEGHYWSWADIPFMIQHAQLGIIHTLLAFHQPDSGYRATSKAIADWQTQLLDSDGIPTTLYQREGATTETQLLATHYILYRAIAQLHQCTRAAAISETILLKLHQIETPSRLPLYLFAVEAFLESQLPPPPPEVKSLPEMIADPKVLIAGYRSSTRSVICSLSGSRTGIGYIRKGDVKILSYGPHGFPLTECQQYGIEAAATLGAGEMAVGENAFNLSRIIKLPAEPPANNHPATFGMLPAPFEFAEIRQEYADDILHVSYKPYSSRSRELGFAFFAQASNCLLSDGTLIKRKSLEQFSGKSQPLALQANHATLTLLPADGTEMQIIPLAGSDDFWGADYLIAFKTPDAGCFYKWKVT